MTTIFMFPGQGSQQKGMGQDLFERYPEYVAEADGILGYSLVELCLENPEERLKQTRYTQPALFAVEALAYQAKIDDGAVAPDYVLGHSLGEYAALYAAGAFDFSTGLKLVQARGEIMNKADGGGMAAILGMAPEKIADVLRENGFDGIDMANYNGPGQTVISGLKADIEAAAGAFEAAGVKRYVVLNVSGAFHSRYMQEAADAFRPIAEAVNYLPLQRPVIANCTAAEYGCDIADLLCRQIVSPVRWTESIALLKAKPEPKFEEVGPGRVLAGMLRRM